MTKQKLTPWFPADVKPVHVGFYETNQPHQKEFIKSKYRWYWDGSKWKCDALVGICFEQNRQWRGIQK